MKKIILTATAALFALTSFSQDLSFNVQGRYSRPVKKEKLDESRFVSDFIPGFPINWITDYVSVEIATRCNGNDRKAVSPNGILNPEQKKLLSSAELADDITININYKYNNPATGDIENNRMHVVMTVVPETEAEYVGGYEKLKAYLKENGISKVCKTRAREFDPLVIRFTINEEGEVCKAHIFEASKDAETDKFLLKVINEMPEWNPAVDSRGIRVKQEFEFSVGNRGGC